MLTHMVLFRDFIFKPRAKAPGAKDQLPYTPSEWAAFNRALYQRRPKATS